MKVQQSKNVTIFNSNFINRDNITFEKSPSGILKINEFTDAFFIRYT